MSQHNFEKTSTDHYVFVKKYENNESNILLFYGDDMLIAGKHNTKISTLKTALSKYFAI